MENRGRVELLTKYLLYNCSVLGAGMDVMIWSADDSEYGVDVDEVKIGNCGIVVVVVGDGVVVGGGVVVGDGCDDCSGCCCCDDGDDDGVVVAAAAVVVKRSVSICNETVVVEASEVTLSSMSCW